MEAIVALMRGEDTYEADVGGFLIAEALHIFRVRGGMP